MKTSLASALVLAAATSPFLFAANPMNLARWQTGATLLVKDSANDSFNPVSPLTQGFERFREASLLSDDPSQGFRLERGLTEVVIDLGMVKTVSEFAFQSFSAGTQCQVSASLRRPSAGASWRGMGQVSVSACASASLSSAPVQARYIKLTFTTETPGQISSLVLTGVEQVETTRVQRPSRLTDSDHPGQPGMLPVDLAAASQGASLIGATGLADGQNPAALSDQNPLTTLALAPSQPSVLVYDLGVDSDVDALAISHSGFKGTMDVYFVPAKLPPGLLLSDDQGAVTMTVSKGFFLQQKPDAVLTIASDDFRSRKSFATKAARFVVARCVVADAGSSSPAIGGLSVIGSRSPERVVPVLLTSLPSLLPSGDSASGVVGVVGAPRRAAAPSSAPRPVAARLADVQVNAADFSSPE